VIRGRPSVEAKRVADKVGLPLFALPSATQLDQVEQEVLRYVVDRRAELHERAQDLHRQLSELALAGQGLPALMRRLYELTGVPVLLEHEGKLEYVGGPAGLADNTRKALDGERPALEEWLREVPLSAFDPPVALRSLGDGAARLIAPILVQGSIAGFLSLVGSEGELGELHRLAVGRAAHACAIELVRAKAALDARDEVDEDLMDLLTTGRPGTHQLARDRARRKGFDVEAPYLVLAAQASASSTRVRSTLDRQLGTMRLPALLQERGDRVLGLISLASRRNGEARAIIDQLHRVLKASPGGAVALGYAAVRSGASEVSKASREAEQALSMGRRLFGAESATAFADLGLYRLLYALQPMPELATYREEVLGRLRAKDRGGVLLQTLQAYLAANGSPTDAADRLHLHRNTVLYRLGRIEELLQVDLRDSEVRLALHLALKIGDVLDSQ
jgi:purine catabolism regulator